MRALKYRLIGTKRIAMHAHKYNLVTVPFAGMVRARLSMYRRPTSSQCALSLLISRAVVLFILMQICIVELLSIQSLYNVRVRERFSVCVCVRECE